MPTPPAPSAARQRWGAVALAAAIWLGGWAIAAIGVRVSLAITDAQPYGPAVEVAYVVLATIWGSIALASPIVAIAVAVRRLRRGR